MTQEIIITSYCADTILQKHQLEMGWLDLAERLKVVRDQALYEGQWNSFEDFLNDPAMGMDKGTASKMISIHEKLIVQYDVDPANIVQAGGWSVIAEVLPVIKDKKSAVEWLEQCANLSKADVRKEVKRARGQDPEGQDCKHEKYYDITLRCCRACGDKELIKSNE